MSFVGPLSDWVRRLQEILAALFVPGPGIEIDAFLKYFQHEFQGSEQEDADAFYLAVLHRLEVNLIDRQSINNLSIDSRKILAKAHSNHSIEDSRWSRPLSLFPILVLVFVMYVLYFLYCVIN